MLQERQALDSWATGAPRTKVAAASVQKIILIMLLSEGTGSLPSGPGLYTPYSVFWRWRWIGVLLREKAPGRQAVQAGSGNGTRHPFMGLSPAKLVMKPNSAPQTQALPLTF